MIYGCSQPTELWFMDFNHVHVHTCMLEVDKQQVCMSVHVSYIYMYIPKVQISLYFQHNS